MSRVLRLRRGDTSTISANTPEQSEVWHNTETNSLHVGDGTKQGGFEIATSSSKEVQAEYYGFSFSNTAAENKLALDEAILNAPDSGVVTINQNQDYLCDRVTVTSKSISIINKGSGKWDATTGGCVTFNNSYTDILSVSSVDNVFISVEGSPARVMRLTVLDSSSYSKGDVVRIVSDEQDPYNTRSNRPKGESAIVVDTDTGYIYLAAPLEDSYDTAQNVRVGKLPKRSIELDLQIKGSTSNSSVIIQLEAAYKPKVKVDITEHGAIVINSKGSYRGEFWLNGTGRGASDGTLSYLLNDSSGTCNTIHDCAGSFFRHLVTTNSDEVATPTNDLQDYGPTRDLLVLKGLSIGALGAPWDDHAGARRSTFANCKDNYPLRNSSTSDTSFQLRGRDATLINPESVNASQTSSGYSLVKISDSTNGTINIDNPVMNNAVYNASFIIGGTGSYSISTPEVIVNGGVVRILDAQSAMSIDGINITFNGTYIENSGMARDFTQGFDLANSANVKLNNVTLNLIGDSSQSSTDNRIYRLEDGCSLMGNVILMTQNISTADLLRSEGTTPVVNIQTLIATGPNVSSVAGTFAQLSYSVMSANNLSFKDGLFSAPVYDASLGGFFIKNLPTSSAGLSSGELWNDAGTVKIVT